MGVALAFWRRQSEAIGSDRALRAFGVVLAFTHLISLADWLADGTLTSLREPANFSVCWPLFPWCAGLRSVIVPDLNTILALYGVATVAVVVALSASLRATRYGLAGLLAITLIKAIILLVDFRLRKNQHYVVFSLTVPYLLLPNKRESVRLILVLIYFWAGTLKINWEWASGAPLYGKLWLFKGAWLNIVCAYVVVLELGISWLLLSRRKALWVAAFAQLMVFHLMSWSVVGFFYPMLMMSILGIVPLTRAIFPAATDQTSGAAVMLGRGPPLPYAMAGVFSALQLTRFCYPAPTALTGEGRSFSLHMFDARIVCHASVELQFRDGRRVSQTLRTTGDARLRCDPVVVHAIATNTCDEQRVHAGFVDLRLRLRSRLGTDSRWRQIVDVSGFCQKHLQYHPFLHNSWINAGDS